MIAAGDSCAVKCALSPGQAGDAPEGRSLLITVGTISACCAMIMDKAYEGDETRNLAVKLGFSPVVPPKSSRKDIYKKRNEIERLFRRLKGFRRVFTRFDKLDRMFMRLRRSCFDRHRNQTVLTGPNTGRGMDQELLRLKADAFVPDGNRLADVQFVVKHFFHRLDLLP